MNKFNDSSCDMLTPYLLGELTNEEAFLFKAHIETCDSCRSELTDLMDIHDKFISVGDDDMVILPPDLKTKTLRKAFEARPPAAPRQKRSWWLRRGQLFILAAAALFIGVVLGRLSSIAHLPTKQIAAAPAQMLNEINLVPTGNGNENGMAIVYQQNENIHLVVYVRHMQALSMYGCYSVWETLHGSRRNLGDFTVDHNGDAVISLSGVNLSSLSSIHITHEPAWNDPRPKGPTVLIPSPTKA
jgi:hypothetical protein